MRRPKMKLMLKTALILLISGSIFLLITSWIAASPYHNKLPGMRHEQRVYDNNFESLPKHEAWQIKPVEQPKLVEDELDNFIQDVQQQQQELPPAPLQVAPEIQVKEQETAQTQQQMHEERQNVDQLLAPTIIKKDWHDYTAMERDAQRIGLGEQGKRAQLDDESQRDIERKMSLENGFNALLSDAISVNRSLPDIRYKGCREKQYLSNLPTVSVVIPYQNEHFSVLVRSLHSLVNRSPTELLKEIILVDDNSDREYLFRQLDQYIEENFKNKVKIIHLPQRTGLIGARMAGARQATAEVLIFLDSHIEATYNWLPPLLEPIALDKRTSVCPFIDVIDHSNFEYRAQDEGARGAFDWEFYYKRLPLLPEDLVDRTKPFRSPIMAGGLFAISSEFFWELGGYDEGLDIWGGEQYELSFKIWMCGGQLLDAPCSRVGHIYRGPRNPQSSPRKGDYLHRNYKRVAEVWMDEYKNYLYDHGQGIYEIIDAGDLSAQHEVRQRLKCKSFKWFMEQVAFDLIKKYPPVEPPDFAYGALQSMAPAVAPLCLDTLGKPRHSEIALYECAMNLKRPQRNQNWSLSWRRDLRLRRRLDCLDVQQSGANSQVWLWDCHGQGGNQFWYYDRQKQWVLHGQHGHRCLEAVPAERKVYVNECDASNDNMRWKFGVVNDTALDNFYKNLAD